MGEINLICNGSSWICFSTVSLYFKDIHTVVTTGNVILVFPFPNFDSANKVFNIQREKINVCIICKLPDPTIFVLNLSIILVNKMPLTDIF